MSRTNGTFQWDVWVLWCRCGRIVPQWSIVIQVLVSRALLLGDDETFVSVCWGDDDRHSGRSLSCWDLRYFACDHFGSSQERLV